MPELIPDTTAIDELVPAIMSNWRVPGAAVAVVRGDEAVYVKGFGVRALGSEDPITPETLFAIGSTTKAMTTAAMAILVDEGKMAWDDPVRKHVEFFRLSDPLADANVTLRDLVCHRTGMSRHDLFWYGSPWNREEIIRKIGLAKSSSSFRSRYEYQNIMFLTAGYAVGHAAGSTWEEFIQQRIFDPLGMRGANFSTKDAEKAPDHATPHRKNKEEQIETIPWRSLDNVAPAGSVNAGVRDLTRWLRLQLGNGTFEGQKLISEVNLLETRTPHSVMRLDEVGRKLNPATVQMTYGLGWTIQDYHGKMLIAHSGGIDGYRAHVAFLPGEKLGIAVLANLATSLMPEAIVNSLVDHFLDLPRRDWNALFLEQNGKWEEEGKTREKERDEKRHKDTRPSRGLQNYTGAYEDAAYGKASVTLENGSLMLQWSTAVSRLEHWHYDTFMAKDEGLLENQQVVFTLGADGEVAALRCLGVDFKKASPPAEEEKSGS